MKQSKLRRTLIQLNETKDESLEILKTNDKTKLIEEVNKIRENIKNFYCFILFYSIIIFYYN